MGKNITHPTVSVVMSVYNGAEYIKEAIDSIIKQTFSDFEFIIIDDGSTDKSLEIVTSYTDTRIILLKNKTNIGLALSLNKGLDTAQGKYIVRMDPDDISIKERFKKQVAYMEKHPDISICGTWAQTIGDKSGFTIKHPTDPDEVKVSLLFRTSLVHPSIIMRKEFLDRYHLRYGHFENGEIGYVEDFDFYTKASQYGKIANIGEILLLYRRHGKQATVEKRKIQIEYAKKVIGREFEWLGIPANEENLQTAVAVKRYLFLEDRSFLIKLENLLMIIKEKNDSKKIYNSKSIEKVFGNIWLEVAVAYYAHNKNVWGGFWKSTLRKWVPIDARNIYRMSKILLFHIYLYCRE